MNMTVDIFSSASVDAAIGQLRDYGKRMEARTSELVQEIAERIKTIASGAFASATGDDVIELGAQGALDVSVTVEKSGDSTAYVVATGKDAVFIEFGAGVHYNGSAGASPHPKGSELGFTIGSYGLGKGANDTWGFFYDGRVVHSYGTPSQAPLYNAFLEVRNELFKIAQEVFRA